jgi:hypothetical protein
MPAAWSSKNEAQYNAIRKVCYKRRKCATAAKTGHTACVTGCFGLSKGKKRNTCIQACKSTKLCKTSCNSMAAATVNKGRNKTRSKRKTRRTRRK